MTATVVLGLAALAVGVGLFAGLSTVAQLFLIGLGCIGLFIGVGLVAARLVRPLAALLGRPVSGSAAPPGSWPGRTPPATPPAPRARRAR